MDTFVIFWLTIGVICVAALYFRHATAASRSKVIEAMVEKGTPIPPDLFQEPRRRPFGSRTFIAAGILHLGVAAGCLVFFLALTSKTLNEHEHVPLFVPFVSAFPFFIGIACLLVGRYFKSHE